MSRTPRLLVLALLCVMATAAQADRPSLVLASTTSTEQSGLFDHVLPRFTEDTGIRVRVVAVGTGQAFMIARRGDADALLVHDRTGEDAFIESGHGIDRRDVMYNDFVLVGPADDPAGVATTGHATAAMAAIAATEIPFTSRGDDSGTHRMEQRLWAKAAIEPRGTWYRELGSGMGATLNTAVGMNAYALTDRATWANFRNRGQLVILLEGDAALHNPYSAIRVNPERHPHVKADLAAAWQEWMTSTTGQAAIASYRLAGEPVFFID